MNVGILGAGAWGTALAVAVNNAGNNVTLWSRNPSVCESVNEENENKIYLKGIKIDSSINATIDIKDIADKDVILLVVPSQTLRQNCEELSKYRISTHTSLIICCKGVEQETHRLMSEIAEEFFPENPIAVLSGPNFAHEVAKGLPACATIACKNEKVANNLIQSFSSKCFRLYSSTDIIGVQIAGAAKNVLAIACGICAGQNLGENAKAALITRGISEIKRLLVAIGGKAETLMGLSGVGDIMLTCGSLTSRNMSFGYRIGQGDDVSNLLNDKNKLAEGVYSSESINNLCKKYEIEMPICLMVNNIINHNLNVNNAISSLLNRPVKIEN